MSRILRPLFPTLAFVAGLGAPAFAEPSFIGIWYSASQPDEPGVMSLIEFSTDGTFREEFVKCENGKTAGYQFQSGTWTVENGVEHTHTDKINGDATNVDDIYQVELLTDTQRRIRMEPVGHVFNSIRVTEFRFPDCASGV